MYISGHEITKNITDPAGCKLFHSVQDSYTIIMIKAIRKLFLNVKYRKFGKDVRNYISNNVAAPDDENAQQKSVFDDMFVGIRFHIYFLDGGLALHYHESIINFFEILRVPTKLRP